MTFLILLSPWYAGCVYTIGASLAVGFHSWFYDDIRHDLGEGWTKTILAISYIMVWPLLLGFIRYDRSGEWVQKD